MNRDLGIPAPTFNIGDEPRDFEEKRRFLRRQLAIRCWIGDGRHTVYARLHDLSIGGLSLYAPVPFSPRAELDVALVLPGALDDPSRPFAIRARGRVIWTRRPDQAAVTPSSVSHRALAQPNGPRIGAEFVEVLEGERLLRRLIERP